MKILSIEKRRPECVFGMSKKEREKKKIMTQNMSREMNGGKIWFEKKRTLAKEGKREKGERERRQIQSP